MRHASAPFEEWLRLAYARGAGCPPPEIFLEASAAGLSREERERVEQHADSCPACTAEQELARMFDAPPEEIELRHDDVQHIVSRLEAAPPGLEKKRALWSYSRLAAAAVFAVALAGTVLMLRSPAPSLPGVVADPVMRGSVLETGQPAGELEAVPETLDWRAHDEAAGYRVRLLQVDDTVVWQATVDGPPVTMPRNIVDSLQVAVVYTWTVEALDDAGTSLARSERVRFRVRPRAEGTER